MSCSDLLTKFDDQVKRFKDEFNEIVEGERAKLKAEVEAFNEEKQKMKAFDVSDDDIIHLNVGGEKFTTTRSTLCQVEDSLLATMFSGRWERGVKRDRDGAVFFDFNPQYFGYILEYLRTKKIATPEDPAEFPKVPRDQAKNFNTLVEYLGLSDEIVVPVEILSGNDIARSEKFILHGPEITLLEDRKVAVHGPNKMHQYALGENIYEKGTAHFRIKLESFRNNGWMFVGIVKAGVQQNNGYSYKCPGSYGWTLGESGQVHQNRSFTSDNSLKHQTKQGDTVQLVLNCDAAKLSLHLPSGPQFQIDLPKSQTWRLNVNLSRGNDKIRIIN